MKQLNKAAAAAANNTKITQIDKHFYETYNAEYKMYM
jgi:hypothetical protein